LISALTGREDQKVYQSVLRAADRHGQRPTAMILHDPYAMHRKWWDADWVPGVGDTEWTDWDFVLAEVYQIIEDYTDKNSGQWIPYDSSGDIWWEVKSSYSGSTEAIEREQKNRGELKPGESLYAVPVFDESKPKPTLESWARDIEDEKADRRPEEHRNARPPTAEEIAALRSVATPEN
jgi:hypothetical protein